MTKLGYRLYMACAFDVMIHDPLSEIADILQTTLQMGIFLKAHASILFAISQ